MYGHGYKFTLYDLYIYQISKIGLTRKKKESAENNTDFRNKSILITIIKKSPYSLCKWNTENPDQQKVHESLLTFFFSV